MNHDDDYKASEPRDAEILTHLITKRDILEKLGKRPAAGPVRHRGLRLIRAAARQRLRPEPRPGRADRHPYRFDARADRPAMDRHRPEPANGPRYPKEVHPLPRSTRHTAALEPPHSRGPSLRPRIEDPFGDPQADPRRREPRVAEHRDPPPPRREVPREVRPESLRRSKLQLQRDRRRRHDR